MKEELSVGWWVKVEKGEKRQVEGHAWPPSKVREHKGPTLTWAGRKSKYRANNHP